MNQTKQYSAVVTLKTFAVHSLHSAGPVSDTGSSCWYSRHSCWGMHYPLWHGGDSSMSVTHRLIPQALSVLSLSQACMYTLCPTLLIPPSLSPPLSLLAAPLISLCLTFPPLPPLPLSSLPCKGSGEYYHLETILPLARLMQPDRTHTNTLKCRYCI